MAVEQQDKSNEVVDMTLTSAITKAVETHQEETESQETKDDKETEGQESDQGTQEDDPQEIEQGRLLIKALKDPQQAGMVIDFLAKQAGYTKQTIETKQDIREAKTDLEAILKESLGDEFGFLAPKLGPAITKSLEALLKDGKYTSDTSDLRARLEKQELKEIQTETARTHVALSQEWFGSDEMPSNVVKAMSKAMDEFPPSDPNMAPERYYRRIFSLVVGELELTKKGRGGSGSTADKTTRNRNDSPARNLASQNRGVVPDIDGTAPRKLSLKDAVSLAVEQVGQASKK